MAARQLSDQRIVQTRKAVGREDEAAVSLTRESVNAVSELTPDAEVAELALELLRLFEEALVTHVGEWDRLQRQLEQLQLPERK